MAHLATFASEAEELPPQHDVFALDIPDLTLPGDFNEVAWWCVADQGVVHESESSLATSHHSSANHDIISDTCPVVLDLDVPNFDDNNIGNADMEDIITFNETSYDNLGAGRARVFDYLPAIDGEMAPSHHHVTPDIDTSIGFGLATINTLDIPGPISSPHFIEHPFTPASSQSPHLDQVHLNQSQLLHFVTSFVNSFIAANERALPSRHNDLPGFSPAQQQISIAGDARMEPTGPLLPAQFQQCSVPSTNQADGMQTPPGFGHGVSADDSHSPSGCKHLNPNACNLPIREAGLENDEDSSRHVNSHKLEDWLNDDLSFDAVRSCSANSLLCSDSDQVINNDYTMTRPLTNQDLLLPLGAASNSLVPYTNRATHAALDADMSTSSQGVCPTYSNKTAAMTGPPASALPETIRVKRKSALPVCGPQRPATKRLKNNNLLDHSSPRNGFSCFAMSQHGDNTKRSNVLSGKSRTRNHQNARDRGVCSPCRKAKQAVSLLQFFCHAHGFCVTS